MFLLDIAVIGFLSLVAQTAVGLIGLLAWIGAKIGSSIFDTIRLKMWKSVPSAGLWLDRMPNSASRWAGVSRSLIIA